MGQDGARSARMYPVASSWPSVRLGGALHTPAVLLQACCYLSTLSHTLTINTQACYGALLPSSGGPRNPV